MRGIRAAATHVPLIPRRTLLGNPERTAVTLSHDGTRVAYLSPLDGVLNVWVAPLDAIGDAKPVTRDRGSGIRHYGWSYRPGHFLYGQDRDGGENWHVHVVEIESSQTRDLTPYDGVQAIPQGLSERIPDEVMIEINRRDPQYHDLYRVHLLNGESRIVVENDVGASRFLIHYDFNPRLARGVPPDGGAQVLTRSGSAEWEPSTAIGSEDDMTTGPLHNGVVVLLWERPRMRTLRFSELSSRSTMAALMRRVSGACQGPGPVCQTSPAAALGCAGPTTAVCRTGSRTGPRPSSAWLPVVPRRRGGCATPGGAGRPRSCTSSPWRRSNTVLPHIRSSRPGVVTGAAVQLNELVAHPRLLWLAGGPIQVGHMPRKRLALSHP